MGILPPGNPLGYTGRLLIFSTAFGGSNFIVLWGKSPDPSAEIARALPFGRGVTSTPLRLPLPGVGSIGLDEVTVACRGQRYCSGR